jgi:hypothetical protein
MANLANNALRAEETGLSHITVDMRSEEDVFEAQDMSDDGGSENSESAPPLTSAPAPLYDAEQMNLERLAGLVNQQGLSCRPRDVVNLPEWSVDYPIYEELDADSFVRLEHTIASFNRRVEASAKTDAVPLDMSCALLMDIHAEPHTRVFEAIGDYIPNLLVAREGSFLAVKPKFTKLTGKPSSFRLTSQYAPISKKWARYRLVNGKYAELRTDKVGPQFVLFPSLPDLFAMPCAGIRIDLTAEEINALPTVAPRSVGELFDEAIERGGGVNSAILLPYYRPQLASYSDSKYMSEWLDLHLLREPRIELPAVETKSEAVRTVLKHLSESTLTDDAEEYLKIIEELLGDDPTDEVLESVYDHMVPHFDLADWSSTEEDPTPIEMERWATPAVPDEDSELGPETDLVAYATGGIQTVVQAQVFPGEGYDLPYPTFLAPEGCGNAALSVLALYPSLHKWVQVKHVSFSADFPWYTMSVTPRKATEERGRNIDGYIWHEKLVAHVNFNGPAFFPRNGKDRGHQHAATILNTAWLEEVVSVGRVRAFPRVYSWPSQHLTEQDLQALPSNARGLGIVNGKLTLSPLLKQREQWESHYLQDLRCVMPRDVLKIVVTHPDRYAIKHLSAYLEGLGPLVIVGKYNSQEKEFVYSEGMRFNPNGTSPEGLFQWDDDVLSVDNEHGGARVRMPTVPPRAIKDRDSTDADWGIPKDRNDVSWQARIAPSWVPFNDVEMFADKVTVNSVGNWSAIIPQLEAAGVVPDVIKNLYSVHWQSANGPQAHPVCRYHNPQWTAFLKGKPVRRELWYWPTKKLAPNPLLSANDAGQLPLTGKDLVTHKKRVQRQDNSRFFFQNIARGGRGRPMGRGRGGAYATPHSSSHGQPRAAPGGSASRNLTATLMSGAADGGASEIW